MCEMMKMDGFDDCILGVSYGIDQENRIVYDLEKVIDQLIADGMTAEEALEYHEYNQLGAYVPGAPVFLDHNLDLFLDEL